jgi:hypothetical protein
MDFAIPLYDALIDIKIPADKARTVVQAFERDAKAMTADLATKADLRELEGRFERRFDAIDAKFGLFEAKLLQLESRMTLKLGVMMAGMIGTAAAVVKLF